MPNMAKPNPAAVEATLANRRSLNANRRTARPRQDLSAVKDGVLTGRGGNKQALGPAAQRRLAGSTTQVAPAIPPGGGPTDMPMAKPMPVAPPPPTEASTLPATLDMGAPAMAAQIQAARAAAPTNPQFSANLPPEIMQRLLALRSGGGMPPGAPGAPGVGGPPPGMAKPGMPGPVSTAAGGAPFNFADYWSQGGGPVGYGGGGGLGGGQYAY